MISRFEPKLEPPKVFVVDDEEDIVVYLVTVLEDNGFRAAGETDAAKALTVIQRERPDLILLDIMMPGQSGLSLYREIRRSQTTATIPVFIITGCSREEDFAEILGRLEPEHPRLPDGYLEKPITVSKLLQGLHRLFDREAGETVVGDLRDLLHAHLFDRAPIAIAVLDRDLCVVGANAKFRNLFGHLDGRHCFELLKERTKVCKGCMAQKTLVDGEVRIHDEGLIRSGNKPTRFVVRVAPLAGSAPKAIPYLIWTASDVNEATSMQLENELLFENAPCYITVLDREMRIIRSNRRMRDTFGNGRGMRCYEIYKRRDTACRDCPALTTFEDGEDHTAPQVGLTPSGEEVQYVVTTSAFSREEGTPDSQVKYVIEMATDVTQLKVLEREKLEAERLAAVGQTVAGLAHGLKNILTGLEGGAYVMQSGLRQNQTARVERGMEMLFRNVAKISSLVKNLLSFSKGDLPKVALTDPNAVAREILELYGDMAAKSGIQLIGDLQADLAPAPLDPDGIHACLANLISNAIDACQMAEKGSCRVLLRTFEADGVLGFEVIDDGCGMNYDVKQKVFTTFFTTKGTGGTGIGLLTTRRIVQEHGGRIVMESRPGEGTTFRILLPRDRLPRFPEEGQGVGPEAKPQAGFSSHSLDSHHQVHGEPKDPASLSGPETSTPPSEAGHQPRTAG